MRELEFMPEDHIRARLHRRIGFIRSWLLLALGLAMVLWSLQMGAWVRIARAELQGLRGAGVAVEADCNKVRKIQAEAETYNRRLAALRQLTPRLTVAELLPRLIDLVPQSVTVEELRFDHPEYAPGDRGTIRVQGWAPDELTVTRMLSAMENDPRCDQVTLLESKGRDQNGQTLRYFVVQAEALAPTPIQEVKGERSPDKP